MLGVSFSCTYIVWIFHLSQASGDLLGLVPHTVSWIHWSWSVVILHRSMCPGVSSAPPFPPVFPIQSRLLLVIELVLFFNNRECHLASMSIKRETMDYIESVIYVS